MTKYTNDDLFQLNPFHDKISNIHLRACVGNNSGISPNSRDCSIIDGYKDTVELLYKEISKNKILIDTAVYPFIFCCRHSIELALKVILKNLMIIYKLKNKIDTRNPYICKIENVCKQHDINALYNAFISFDDFQIEIKEELINFKYFENCIKDYYFDINGDSFRYTFKKNLEKINLEEIEIIDIGLLYWKYKNLMKFFDYLINGFSRQLLEDYTKTYTKHLSRTKLELLSLDLKDLNKLTGNELNEKVKELCEKYNISKSEFNIALKKIKKHYSFSINLGIENRFKELTEESFRKIGEIYKMSLKEKAAQVPLKNKFQAIDITEIDKYYPLADEYYHFCLDIVHSLTEDEKKVFLTFYEITSHPINGDYLCEDIDYIYNSWGNNLDDDYVSEKISLIINNGKLREALIKCGQLTYLFWYDKYIKKNDYKTT